VSEERACPFKMGACSLKGEGCMKRVLTEAMIRDIAARYPELQRATWEDTVAYIRKQQAESYAEVALVVEEITRLEKGLEVRLPPRGNGR
jgi:hypothetical protein